MANHYEAYLIERKTTRECLRKKVLSPRTKQQGKREKESLTGKMKQKNTDVCLITHMYAFIFISIAIILTAIFLTICPALSASIEMQILAAAQDLVWRHR
jgi:hypothetical protein